MDHLDQERPDDPGPGRHGFAVTVNDRLKPVTQEREGMSMSVNLKSLIGKLNDTVRGALEGAAGLCLSRTHYDVEIEHFLMKLLDSSAGDLACILRYFEVDRNRLSGELTRTLDKLKSGNARTPAMSPTLVKMMTEAWTLGSIDFGSGQVRSGYAILALVSNEE